MFNRTLKTRLEGLARQFPVVSVIGPRQSGKTTLVQLTFPQHTYINLENPEERDFAIEDPKGFLSRAVKGIILDEIQRVPDLFSYIQILVDEDRQPGRWILTGSQNFLLMHQISQTLAGRTTLLQLLPLSILELYPDKPDITWNETLFKGLYPEIWHRDIDPKDWFRGYIQTYVERDMRDLIRIGDLTTFSRFLRLCAGRTGQLLNFNGLAVDCGISQPTAKSWLSILETCGLIMLLRPHYANFSKRLVKTPKLYWVDPGLLCHFLRVLDPDDLYTHPYRGAIFETFVVSELFKAFLHNGMEPDIYFWRDRSGHEIDALVQIGRQWIPLEIKSSETVSKTFFRGLNYWLGLDKGEHSKHGILVCAGKTSYQRSGHVVLPWWGAAGHLTKLL